MHSANIVKTNGNYMTPLNFYLLTDTHYFEESLGAEGKAYEEYMKTEAFYLKESSTINKAIFQKLKDDKETEIIIIPGDLSKDGEYESHKSLIKELTSLKESGKSFSEANKLLKKWYALNITTVTDAEYKKKKTITGKVEKSYDVNNVGRNSILEKLKNKEGATV